MSADRKRLVIFGDGAIAELAHFYFAEQDRHEIVAFAVDAERRTADTFRGLPLVAFETVDERYPPGDFAMFIAIGYGRLNQSRQEKFRAARAMGYDLPGYVARSADIASNVAIGANCFILENQTVQPFCKIGDNVTLWSGNHIGHHSEIGNHTFIASQVVISGNCRFGERCFVGVNATFRDGCAVGDDSFIGMAAAVSADVPAGAVVLGSSSDILPADDRRARAVKRSFFRL